MDGDGGRKWCMKQGMAMFTSPEDHRGLSVHPRIEVMRNLQQTAAAPFSKVDPPSAPEQENSRGGASVPGVESRLQQL